MSLEIAKALQCSLATYQWPQIPHMLSPTMFEDANEERVVTLNVPPGGRWVVLWLGQIETKRPGASVMVWGCWEEV